VSAVAISVKRVGSDMYISCGTAEEMPEAIREQLDRWGKREARSDYILWRIWQHTYREHVRSGLEAHIAAEQRAPAPTATRPVVVRERQPWDIYQAPRERDVYRGGGLCIECGNPTDRPGHLYCIDCYRAKRGY
jgi:hypothetical protein